MLQERLAALLEERKKIAGADEMSGEKGQKGTNRNVSPNLLSKYFNETCYGVYPRKCANDLEGHGSVAHCCRRMQRARQWWSGKQSGWRFLRGAKNER